MLSFARSKTHCEKEMSLNDQQSKALRKEAVRLVRETERILKHRGHRLTPTARNVIDGRISEVRAHLTQPSRLEPAMKALRDETDRHSAVLRKASAFEYVQSFGSAILIALFIRAFFIEAFKIPTGSMIPTLMVGDHLFVNKLSYGPRIPFTNVRIAEFGQPERGEIVVFVFPGEGDDHGKDFIKRIVAVAGDRVRLTDNVLFVNGEAVITDPGTSRQSCSDDNLTACQCIRQTERLGDVTYVTQHVAPGSDVFRGCMNNPDWPSDDPRQIGNSAHNPDFPEVVVPQGHVFAMGDNRDNSSDGRFWGFIPVEHIKGRALFIWWPLNRMFRSVH